ncbi:MAG: hypothetical protein JWN34_4237 [Bryobacterales bacterium]|nr:hypothetical protein [Bryobacterales bacterium]
MLTWIRRRLMFRIASLGIGVVGGFLPCIAQDSFDCPVTKAAPVKFEPTGTFAGYGARLFGDEKLFTVFPGNWGLTQRRENGYRIPKIVWGTNTFDLRKDGGGSALTITGRRLDATSGPLRFDVARTAWDSKGPFITSEFYVPALGCWEVVAHFHEATLQIVINLAAPPQPTIP